MSEPKQPSAGAVKLAKEMNKRAAEHEDLICEAELQAIIDRNVAPLVDALEYYTDRLSYLHGSSCPPICTDEGETARAALKQWRDGK